MPEIPDTQAALNAGKHLSDVRKDHAGTPFIVLPQGDSIRDIEHLLDKPRIKRGQFQFESIESFCEYVNEHKGPSTRVFATVRNGITLTAVIDLHSPTDAAWGKHRATYAPKSSDEWTRWVTNASKWHSQLDFAQLIEDSLEDFNAPKGVEMLDVARNIEGAANVTFGEAHRTESGDYSIAFKRTTTVKAGEKGDLTIPAQFVLSIPVFDKESKVTFMCKLRYRVNDGKIEFKYDIPNLSRIVEQAVTVMVEEVRSKTKLTVFYGTAPSI